MRPIWSGAISFGLVNIPVRMFSATAGTDLSFHYLRKSDHSPISYQKIARADGKVVPFDEIEKGYEYRKGDYVVVTDEDFAKANKWTTHTIDIVDFVDDAQVEDMLFDRPYFLEPSKGADRPYALLREAMKKSKKIGIAKFVLRNREHLGAVKPMDNVIMLDQLRFSDEVRLPTELRLPATRVTKKEMDMATALIKQLTTDFKASSYKDDYQRQLKRVIAAKAKGKKPAAKGSEPKTTPVKDLMSVLTASLEQGKVRA
jgi:DNA end-binding protein Ku